MFRGTNRKQVRALITREDKEYFRREKQKAWRELHIKKTGWKPNHGKT